MDADEMYAAGYALEQQMSVGDLPAIEDWYRRAAAAGSTEAMARLGLLLEGRIRAQMEGRSRSTGNYPEAARWYRRAADQGDTFAMFLLGRLYADKLNDWSSAEPLLRRVAASGRVPGGWQAREMLQEGPAGVLRRRQDDAFMESLNDRVSRQRSGSSGTGSSSAASGGGCTVAIALTGLLPVLLTLLAVTGRSG